MKLFILNDIVEGDVYAIIAKSPEQALKLATAVLEEIELALSDGEAELEEMTKINLTKPCIQGYHFGR